MTTHKCTQEGNIAWVKESVALTNKDISYMKEEISDIKKNQEQMNIKMDTLIDKLENKFAAKRTEIAVKWFMGSVFAYIIYLVLERTMKWL